MTRSRRAFLKQTASGAVVLGLPQLLTDVPTRSPAEPLGQALAQMKKHGLYGVAIAIPDDARGKKLLGKHLEVLVTWPLAQELRHLALEAVYVVAPRSALEILPKENAILLDPKGKRVAGTTVEFSSTPAMANGFRHLLEGDGRRKQRIDASATPQIKEDVAALAEDYGQAYQRLYANERRAMPLVIATLESPKTGKEHKGRLRSLVSSSLQSLSLQSTPLLPFGVEWKITKKGFDPEPCPPCGMALPRPAVRKFLRFAKR